MIHTIRGVRVILNRDLARIYAVPTFRLNEAIKRNRHRFPPDFMFQLTREEFNSLKSQLRCQSRAVAKVDRLFPQELDAFVTHHPSLVTDLTLQRDGVFSFCRTR